MSIVLDGTTGITTPGLTNTGTETIVNLTTTGNTILGDASTDTLNVGNGGLVKDASGNVGIGTTSPAVKLDVSNGYIRINEDGLGTKVIQLRSNWAGVDPAINVQTNNSLLFATNGTERMRIDSSGNVGIGTSSPGDKLSVNGACNLGGASGVRIGIGTAFVAGQAEVFSQDSVRFGIGTAGAQPVSFYSNSAERMRIDTSGNLLVGKTVTSVGTAGIWLEGTGSLVSSLAASTASSSTLHAYSTTASAYRFYVGMDGRVNATLTTISAISDERLKENIKDLDFGLSEVLSLKPRRFDWKEGKGADTKDAVGFIAQEFETVFPNSVGTAKAGEDGIEYKNICHDELIPTLVKAIQELKALVDTQASTITALQADVEALKAQP